MTAVESADTEVETPPPDEGESGAIDCAECASTTPVGQGDPLTEEPKHEGVRSAVVVALGFVGALAGLMGWLGYQAYEAHQQSQQQTKFVETARRQAVNLTTISNTDIESDVKRIVDSSTGTFHEDFQKRSPAFVDVVKQAQSTSVGTVTAAGVESMAGDQARVLVAVSVKTSNAGAPEQQPRGWRMRITVTRVGDDLKVSDVAFVP